MKVSTCLLTLLLLLAGSYASAQEPVYYWSDEKIYLYPIPDMAVFRTDGDTLSVDLNNWLSEKGITVEKRKISMWPEDAFYYKNNFFAWGDSSSIPEFMQRYQNDPEIMWADYFYDWGYYDLDGHVLRPIERLTFKFWENTTQSERDSILAKYELSIIYTSVGGFHSAIAPPKTNYWDLGNEMTESGDVYNAAASVAGGGRPERPEPGGGEFVAEINPGFSISVFPNPANPVATISYSIPHDSNVLIDVYSVTGQRIATLVDGFKQAGSHTVVFDGTSLSTGVYFYKVSAGRLTRTGKITLVK